MNASPGIFTQDSNGKGAGVILNADSSVNSPSDPSAQGSLVTISATGEGQTNPPGVDGQLASDTPPSPAAAVAIQIGGIDAIVVSSGGVPGLAAGDAVPVVIAVGGVPSQPGVTLSVQ